MIVIMIAKETCIWVDASWIKQVECHNCMRNQAIAFSQGIVGSNGAGDGDNMIFECSDGVFGYIGMMLGEWN